MGYSILLISHHEMFSRLRQGLHNPGVEFEGSCCAAGADKEHANNSAGEALVLGLLGAYSVKLNLVALLRYSPTGCCCLRNTLRQKKVCLQGTATASWVIFSTATVGAVEENVIVRYHPY